ncbi:MAG: restriction endonuclease, partial [Desulfobacterales bacterium CG23_combo_of_CG06-09_8_20_14_all_51_8]
HTFWFLPSVASCHAMCNLLKKRQNRFYQDYKVIVAAGSAAGIGVAALPPVLEGMDEPLKTKTITLSCGKLTTGVTVRPWTGILMLRNSSTPETYFQAAFRVQSPWTVINPDGASPNEEQIIKEECYVFDFAPDRALRQIADYSCRLNVNEANPEKKVEEFISFLPVLAYDGSSMKQIDAAGILDMAMSGTTATLLARRWESALLVNVDNDTLRRLMDNPKAMEALMSIEGFRNLNQDIETIINKSEAVKKARKEANDEELSAKEKKELTDAEKEYK